MSVGRYEMCIPVRERIFLWNALVVLWCMKEGYCMRYVLIVNIFLWNDSILFFSILSLTGAVFLKLRAKASIGKHLKIDFNGSNYLICLI